MLGECLSRGVETGDVDFEGYGISSSSSSSSLLTALEKETGLQQRVFRFSLKHCSLESAGIEALYGWLSKCAQLRFLDLSNNNLDSKAGATISHLLSNPGGVLQEIDLQDNQLGDEGVVAIARSFCSNLKEASWNDVSLSLFTLRELDLSHNQVGDAAVLALCKCLLTFAKQSSSVARPSFLKVLRLDRNRLGDNSALCLASLLQSSYANLETNGETATLSLEELSINDK